MKRRILVTGAGARIGQLLAIALAKTGWHVVVHYNRSKSGAEQTLRDIKTAGGTGELLQADLSDHRQTVQLIPELCNHSGPLHALINNASLFENDNLAQLQAEQWDQQFAVNVKAPVFLAQTFAAQLPKNEQGHVINLLDQRLARLQPGFFSYTLSKAALQTATTTMAQALAPQIQVNAVSPGPTLPNTRQSAADFEQQQRTSLLQHGSPPDEIIAAVLFLLTASAITGQTLIVDGGQHLSWQTDGGKE
ncbi:FolM Alternative dihydrofolate reductase 1 [hydrothermal vent metagenome]|uniref:FolM Alternative dihydrofolate reductase 1 n=1 Tax=hydrothermal vent metagenome TaxID=652676 RepID=A0A3B0S5D6_9ZZZZ